MPTKIRLQRHGKKKNSFYHIVIADGRAPRDGKFIDKIGTYNPNTNPATIDLQFDKALNWLQKGAQPTDTAKAILSYEGVLFKNHLDKGVLKGALKEEEATSKFEAWKSEKLAKISAKTDNVTKAMQAEMKKRLAAEAEVKEKRAQQILAKASSPAPEAEAAVADEPAQAVAEAPEAAATEVVETPAVAETEVKEEAPKAEAAEEKTEEKADEAPEKAKEE